MSQKYYKDIILGGIMKEWIDRGGEFVLEEDRDSGHGLRSRDMTKFKKELGLRYYFNAPSSPDLSPIEAIW
jgi:hypothetical protein